MDSLPLISVIIPCYNVQDFVERAINSIIEQTYKKLEIWVIDDGSTDNTLQKITSIEDRRIKVATFNSNTKKIGAVNEILQKVTGDFITFQDADDWSEPSRLQEQLNEFLKENSLGICFTNYRFTGKSNFIPDKISLTNEDLKEEFLYYNHNTANGSSTVCGTMMISKKALIKTGGYHSYFRGRVGEDIHWIYRILKHFNGMTINKVLYNYNIRNGSFTQIQSTGASLKYNYSWHLLERIIRKDIDEGIDILAPANSLELNKLELESCETALRETIESLNQMRKAYEESFSFKLGKAVLAPLRILKNTNNK